MAIGSDVTSIDHAPERGASASMVTYFIIWVGIGSLLLPNLFVGVLVDTYAREREKQTGYALMTADQVAWTRAMEIVHSRKAIAWAPQPAETWRRMFYSIVTHSSFDGFVLVVILA